jgi:hypothetical protein
MKYFTPEWWGGEVEDQEAPVTAYWQYIDTIRPHLTPGMTALLDDVSLHDAHLNNLRADMLARRLTMILLGEVNPWSPDGEGQRQFTITYHGVTTFSAKNEPVCDMLGTDLGYCEFERLEGGRFEHRMLFANGTEFVVEFADLQLEFVDLKEPVAEPDTSPGRGGH